MFVSIVYWCKSSQKQNCTVFVPRKHLNKKTIYTFLVNSQLRFVYRIDSTGWDLQMVFLFFFSEWLRMSYLNMYDFDENIYSLESQSMMKMMKMLFRFNGKNSFGSRRIELFHYYYQIFFLSCFYSLVCCFISEWWQFNDVSHDCSLLIHLCMIINLWKWNERNIVVIHKWMNPSNIVYCLWMFFFRCQSDCCSLPSHFCFDTICIRI